jgi:sialidase-1
VPHNVKIQPFSRFLCAAFVLLLAVSQAFSQTKGVDLFEARKGGYALYRIPTIVTSPGGAVLVFCEARSSSGGDWGSIDLLMRCSPDGGTTWQEPRKIAEAPPDAVKSEVAVEQKLGKGGGFVVGNPVAISDPVERVVHLLYCIEYARCFYTRSNDDGKTFSKPVEITSAFEAFRKDYSWRVLATGPGHAIRLSSGRLVVPVWLSTAASGAKGHGHRPSCVATVYSDDAGQTWKAGDIVVNDPHPINPSESTVAQLGDGRVMINFRHEGELDAPAAKDRPTWRGISISGDGASGWSKHWLDRGLAEPICMGSLLRVGSGESARLLFSNPDNSKDHRRRNLTIHISSDDGKIWSDKRVIDPDVSGYSDLAPAPDGKSVFCFYERGSMTDERHNDIAALTLVRVNLDYE